jgi:hypothetical protein
MNRRIIAWVLLIGFVLLLLNLIVFRYHWKLSMAVYLIIMLTYVFTGYRMPWASNGHMYDSGSGSDSDASDDDKPSSSNDSEPSQ